MVPYPQTDALVAATCPTTSPRPRADRITAERAALREHGAVFALLLQQEITSCARAAGTNEGGDLLKDLGRGRCASIVQYGAALAALARDPQLSRVRRRRILGAITAWMDSLAPEVRPSFYDALTHEAVQQAEADVATMRMVIAWETNDRTVMRAALDEITDHIASLEQLRAIITERLLRDAPRRPWV